MKRTRSLPVIVAHLASSAVVGLVGFTELSGCGDDAAQDVAPAPPGPPGISIESPSPGECVPLEDEAASAVRVEIRPQNWSLRPPGFCGVYIQCGYAVFFVDGVRVVDSASLVTDVPLAALPSPSGMHTVRVELHDDADMLALDAEGLPLAAEVSIETVEAGEACP